MAGNIREFLSSSSGCRRREGSDFSVNDNPAESSGSSDIVGALLTWQVIRQLKVGFTPVSGDFNCLVSAMDFWRKLHRFANDRFECVVRDDMNDTYHLN